MKTYKPRMADGLAFDNDNELIRKQWFLAMFNGAKENFKTEPICSN
ncbi:MAG: hypothetical protein GY928_02280 [Colwellia sp.]|nr:hypothetical protein [Colwellia sp.]